MSRKYRCETALQKDFGNLCKGTQNIKDRKSLKETGGHGHQRCPDNSLQRISKSVGQAVKNNVKSKFDIGRMREKWAENGKCLILLKQEVERRIITGFIQWFTSLNEH